MKRSTIILLFTGIIIITGCRNAVKEKSKNSQDMTRDSLSLYGNNRDFIKKYVPVIELRRDNSAIVLVPAWQGRVMTSTAEGENGYSFGWVNRGLISSGKILSHINAFGGEERLWLGPEGGQFSIFFRKGAEFTFERWQTPAFIDTMPYEVLASSDTSALFRIKTGIENYSGTRFDLTIDRKVTLLSETDLKTMTGISVRGLSSVAYHSENSITNSGKNEWKKENGLLSLWMLGMYNPSPAVVVVIPVKEGDESSLGKRINDNYFGSISPDRLKVEGNLIFFRADGKSRGKIGVPPLRAENVMGSFDSQNNILTLLFCKLPVGITEYVNSAWQIQENPFSGDAFNSYNDGPLEDGSQMGPFYELETSSPAAALAPGGTLTHNQITVHLTGDRRLLDEVSIKILGVSLEKIETVFR
jgi:hypothetical protein